MSDAPAADLAASSVSVRGPSRLWPDIVLAAVVVAFAYLSASFTARNSDLWMHLAAGRLLAAGDYPFGTEPFAYTTDGVRWANHDWLTEWAMYMAYLALGGAGLVALKAGVAALTVGVMLAASRGPGPFWVSAGVILLAALAMTPRLLLQPACVSLLLLALTLFLYRKGGRAHLAIPILIAAWGNLNEWYALGPLFVGLGVVGGWLSRSAPDEPRPRWWLLPACLAACFVTPYHVHGLTLPAELSSAVWTSAFPDDPRFAGAFASPWRLGPLGAAGGYNLAAWGFWALLGLGLASFAVNRRAAIGWRGTVWLGFAALACWQVRLVPFFAVVAGPITALNLTESLPAVALVRSGRFAVGGLGLALVALTWPGWLQGFAARDRGLAWAAAPDPGLERAARSLNSRRKDGSLPPASRVLVTHPDLAHHVVWFCPGERVFVDSRLTLFTGVAAEYAAASRSVGLLPSAGKSAPEAGLASAGPFATGGAACVILYDPDPRRLATAVRTIVADSTRWTVLAVEGGALFVGSNGAGTLPTGHRLSPDRLAFGPASDIELPPAPAEGAALASEPAPWWAPRNRPRRTAWEGDAASVYLRLFESGYRATRGAGESVAPSPALPILAARAARGAVAASPADDLAWQSLALAYLFLSRGTWEVDASRAFPLLGRIRQVQVAAALLQAVTAHPDSAAGHEALAGFYAERGFMDLSVRHLHAQLRLVRRRGPAPGESADAHAERLGRLTDALAETENAWQDAENRLAVRTYGQAGDPMARARTAAALGLPGRAIDILTESHADLYGPDGLRLLLELLLWTGRAQDARALLERGELRRNPGSLGGYEIPVGLHGGRPWVYRVPAYDWFDLCEAAAAGRYAGATAVAERLRVGLGREEASARRPAQSGATFLSASVAGMGALPAGAWGLPYPARECRGLGELLAQIDFLAVARADLHVLEGVLNLEQGAGSAAAEQFAVAQGLYDATAGRIPVQPGRRVCERYAQAIREARP